MKARAVVFLWLASFGVLLSLVLGSTRYVSDLASFLPDPQSPTEALMIAQLSDGIASRLVLIGIEGSESTRVAAASKAMAQALRASGKFRYVANGEPLLGTAAEEKLFAWRYHLSAAVTPDRFTAEAMRSALEARLDALASPLGAIVRRWLPRDPTGEFLALIAAQSERAQPPMHEGVWFDVARGRALLVAESMSAGFDMHEQRQVQDVIGAAFGAIKGDQALSMVLAGPSVIALKSQESIQRDAWWLTVASTMLVFAVLLFAYRSTRLTLIAFLPVASGIVAAIAAVGLAFGTCHIITIGFGATLIGEAVDYPTYLFMQRRGDENVADTARRIGPSLRIAVLTTVLGSAAMLASSFNGIAQLGLFTLVGVGVAGMVTRFVLPILTPGAGTLGTTGFKRGGQWMDRWIGHARRARLVVPLVLVASIAILVAPRASIWERDLERLNPIADQDKLLDEQMRDTVGAPDVRYLVTVRGDSIESVLDRFDPVHKVLDQLIVDHALASYDSPARYLPGPQAQGRRIAALPAQDELEARLRKALSGLPFKDDLFAGFLADVARAQVAPSMHPADLDGTPWRSALDAMLVKVRGQWTGLAPLAVVRDAGAIERAVGGMNDPGIGFFDLKRESDAMLSTHGWRSLLLALFGLAFIIAVLFMGTRNAGQVCRIVLPVIAAIAATAALLVSAGTLISFLHVVSLLLVLGTGVNYALFFAATESDANERGQAARAISVATLTTLCGFGVLTLAATPILHTIGVTVIIGAALSFLFSAAWASRAPSTSEAAALRA
ncbi:MAG: MMPL family transporter [Burkholderiales bacterium]